MPRPHTHWEGGKPCSFPTKKACNEAIKAFLDERKRRYDENQTKMAREKRERQERNIDAFIEKTWNEMNERAATDTPARPAKE